MHNLLNSIHQFKVTVSKELGNNIILQFARIFDSHRIMRELKILY